MNIDIMTGPNNWAEAAALARATENAGFSGLLFTETAQVPWMQIAIASQAAEQLFFTTGIAVAFPRSPMITATTAYEVVGNTGGRFRLGLGSQVKAHITRRYGVEFDHPAARLRDYVLAVKACFRAFNQTEKLAYEGEFYQLTLLPRDWSPRPHDHPMKVDISAVGPVMTRVAGEVADGVHVHPLHSMAYIENRLLPLLAEGAASAGRSPDEIDLMIPVFTVTGETAEEKARAASAARRQIGFYGTTPNYAFQFDELGFEGTTGRLREAMKAGDLEAMEAAITDEMLDTYAVVADWDDLADRLVDRYRDRATRIVLYSAAAGVRGDGGDGPAARTAGRWAEVARAVRAAS
ncbi:MAG: TIGR03617 family F420-dependent LLM class oxidoreductase [Acidimicrobiia bacterium]|nr:TIGR03617 family F420-dependent LLM class oxidoreductase [Acidimicrobiia bacterium]